MRSQLPSAWGWLLLTLGVLAVLPVILAFAAYRYRPRWLVDAFRFWCLPHPHEGRPLFSTPLILNQSNANQ